MSRSGYAEQIIMRHSSQTVATKLVTEKLFSHVLTFHLEGIRPSGDKVFGSVNTKVA